MSGTAPSWTGRASQLRHAQQGSGRNREANSDARKGSETTYYPDPQLWLDLQQLQLPREVRAEADDKPPQLTTMLRGEARLEDYDISIIGEPDAKSRSLTVSLQVRDVSLAMKEADAELRDEFHGKPVGYGTSASTGVTGRSAPPTTGLACYVTDATQQALVDAVSAGALKSVKLGLRLRHLYSTDHPFAPISVESHLFLRPRRSDSTLDWPQPADGHIFHLSMGLGSVDMRPVEIKQDTTRRSPWTCERCVLTRSPSPSVRSQSESPPFAPPSSGLAELQLHAWSSSL